MTQLNIHYQNTHVGWRSSSSTPEYLTFLSSFRRWQQINAALLWRVTQIRHYAGEGLLQGPPGQVFGSALVCKTSCHLRAKFKVVPVLN